MPLADDLAKSAAQVGTVWKQNSYYDDAEQWTRIFWDQPEPFRSLFDKLDLRSVIELACGHGRHAERMADRCGKVTLIDMHAENIDFCRQRLSRRSNVNFIVNNGFDLRPYPDVGASSLFCYDAMVHFSPEVIGAYLFEIARVLAPGGMALLHHSNNSLYPQWSKEHNPHARNYMSQGLFAMLARGANLSIVRSHPIKWGGVDKLDCVTLLRRPQYPSQS